MSSNRLPKILRAIAFVKPLDEQDTTVAPQHRPRLPKVELVGALLLCGLFAAYLLVKPGSPHEITFVDNLAQTFLEAVGFVLVLPIGLPKGGQRSEGNWTSQHWVPLLLSLCILSYVFGQATWTVNENLLHKQVLFPSWADAGYLGSYPFLVLAVLLLPRQQLNPWQRARLFLDGLLIMIGLSTVSWYFAVGPTFLQSSDTLASRLIGTAYPVATVLVMGCLLVLATRYADERLRPALMLLMLALVTIIITDSMYNYQILSNRYMTGRLLDVGWPLGYLLVGLSARSIQIALASPSAPPEAAVFTHQQGEEGLPLRGREKTSSAQWQTFLSLLVVTISLLLLIWTEFVADVPLLTPGVAVGVALLLGVLAVRQLLVQQEMMRQSHQLQRTHQQLIAKNEDLHRAYQRLEEQAWVEGAYEQERRINQLKDQLLLNVSHELRTPLTHISGSLELLETFHETLTSEEQLTFLEQARHGCDSLLQLITSMLETVTVDASLPEPHLQNIALTELLHDVLKQFGPQREHPVVVEVTNETVVADAQFLRQVLSNLLSNAFKYTPSQTVVKITTVSHPAVEPSDQQVCLCVQDAGPGIPPQDIALLFGKFVRLKRDLAGSIRGTGLGLYISKQLVEKMGGRIWVESAGVTGQGSYFYVALPAPHP